MHFQPGFLPHQWHRAAAWHRTTQICKKWRMSLPIWNPLMISRRKQARTAAGAGWSARANMTALKKGIQAFSLLLLKYSGVLGDTISSLITQERFCLCHVSEHFFQSLYRFVKWTGVIKRQLKTQTAPELPAKFSLTHFRHQEGWLIGLPKDAHLCLMVWAGVTVAVMEWKEKPWKKEPVERKVLRKAQELKKDISEQAYTILNMMRLYQWHY